MNYEEFFNRAFANIREDRSCPDNETILKDVLERAKKMEKKNFKMKKSVVIAASAAAAAALIAVSAGAVLNWDWGAVFSGNAKVKEERNEWFLNNSEPAAKFFTGNRNIPADSWDYTVNTKMIGERTEFDGFTLDVIGVISNGKAFDLFYDVTVTDDKYSQYLNGEWDIYFNADHPYQTDADGSLYSDIIGTDVSAGFDGNVYHGVFHFASNDGTPLKGRSVAVYFSDGLFHKPVWDGEALTEEGWSTENVFDFGDYSCTVDLDFDVDETYNIRKEVGEKICYHDFDILVDNERTPVDVEGTLEYIELTPLGLEYKFIEAEGKHSPTRVTVTMNDGTTVDLSGYTGRSYFGIEDKLFALFEVPVNTKDVVSVSVGDLTIPLA